MILLYVNLLVYAARADATEHERYRAWLESVVRSLNGEDYPAK